MSLIAVLWSYARAQVRTRIKDEAGASLVEYALLLAFIAVVCIAAITFLGNRTSAKFDSVGSRL
ncbi:MAG: Flp family type IVb pilin [Acidimicrobiales bacterium]